MRDSEVCAHCGATTTELRFYPVLMGWYCTGSDGELCDTRRRLRPW